MFIRRASHKRDRLRQGGVLCACERRHLMMRYMDRNDRGRQKQAEDWVDRRHSQTDRATFQ